MAARLPRRSRWSPPFSFLIAGLHPRIGDSGSRNSPPLAPAVPIFEGRLFLSAAADMPFLGARHFA